MTRAKTPAQWQREVPAYDTAVRAVEAVRATGRFGRTEADIDPGTRVVSILLHSSHTQACVVDQLLADYGIPARGWRLEGGHGHEIWRKEIT